jgi:hypothetical protein
MSSYRLVLHYSLYKDQFIKGFSMIKLSQHKGEVWKQERSNFKELKFGFRIRKLRYINPLKSKGKYMYLLL